MVGRQPGDLVQRVADEQDRDAGLTAQALEIGQDLALAGLVERGQRLVEQEQARAGEQRPADRHALPLAARERAGPALEQGPDAKQLHHLVEAAAALGGGRANQRP